MFAQPDNCFVYLLWIRYAAPHQADTLIMIISLIRVCEREAKTQLFICHISFLFVLSSILLGATFSCTVQCSKMVENTATTSEYGRYEYVMSSWSTQCMFVFAFLRFYCAIADKIFGCFSRCRQINSPFYRQTQSASEWESEEPFFFINIIVAISNTRAHHKETTNEQWKKYLNFIDHFAAVGWRRLWWWCCTHSH